MLSKSEPAVQEAKNLLELYLFSMEPYHRIEKALPFSGGFLDFDGTSSTVNGAIANFEADLIALETRLMLQRKYFQWSEAVHFMKIVDALRVFSETDSEKLSDLLAEIARMRELKLEICCGSGEVNRGTHQNVEDSAYGFLLHADLEKARRVATIADAERILGLKETVLSREHILLLIEDAIRDAGFASLRETVDADAAEIVRFSKTVEKDLNIRRSPKWRNLVGKDIDEDELAELLSTVSFDDVLAILVTRRFLELLAAYPLDINGLRKLTPLWTWNSWGDYSEAAALYASFDLLGNSTRVRHEGGEDWSQVIILEGVESPFATSSPQLVEVAATVELYRVEGIWKVVSFVDHRPNRCIGVE